MLYFKGIEDALNMEIATVSPDISSQTIAEKAVRGKRADSNDQAFERARELGAQQQLVASARVSLSAQGEAQSAVAEVQRTGRGLTGVARTGSVVEIRNAAADLVEAYNKADSALGKAAPTQEAPPGEGVREAVAAANPTELQKIGIARNDTGKLSLDSPALETALITNVGETRSIVARLGETLQTAASRQLPADSPPPSRQNPADGEVRRQETQRAPEPEQAAISRRNEDQESRRITNPVTGGVASYQKIFGI
ncbi:MAG: hypothetical protein OEL88_12550 [Sterolibacteriaceae bacterium MAG5]|nr:hypothetical protein [Candidatus Nitricoxidireducens bremensis]